LAARVNDLPAWHHHQRRHRSGHRIFLPGGRTIMHDETAATRLHINDLPSDKADWTGRASPSSASSAATARAATALPNAAQCAEARTGRRSPDGSPTHTPTST